MGRMAEAADRVELRQLADQVLLQRALAGEREGWVELCKRFDGFIARCATRVLWRYGVRPTAEDLDDLVSEVWVALLRDDCRKLRVYDPGRGCRLQSWIGLIATNTTIDYLRVHYSAADYLEDHPHYISALVEVTRPDTSFETRQNRELARRAIGRLKAEEQRFVRFCFDEERQPTDIAREMGISVNTVHSRKFKVREKLTRIATRMGLN